MAAAPADTVTVQLGFVDARSGRFTISPTANKSFPKERLEVFASGRVLQLDNFRKLAGFGWPGFGKMNLWRQDKAKRRVRRRLWSA